MIVDALFLAQALDEVQVGFVVLHAVLARRVDHRAKPEAVGIGLDAMFFEHRAMICGTVRCWKMRWLVRWAR